MMEAACAKAPVDTAIPVLGPAKIPSPLPYCRFDDDARARIELDAREFGEGSGPCLAEFEAAGPRSRIYYDSAEVEAAIVTCCHSGLGGTGDVAILSASNRMGLMPFAQISTRIGGAAMVVLAVFLLKALG